MSGTVVYRVCLTPAFDVVYEKQDVGNHTPFVSGNSPPYVAFNGGHLLYAIGFSAKSMEEAHNNAVNAIREALVDV